LVGEFGLGEQVVASEDVLDVDEMVEHLLSHKFRKSRLDLRLGQQSDAFWE
jgi:hypothetical protein